jgi:hypothetical protein
MSLQLREGLRGTANEAGLSLNAFAVQVLAAAAGDPARFRLPAPAPKVREFERDHTGFPLDWRARDEHRVARSKFIDVMQHAVGAAETGRLVRKYDVEDPAYFVEWQATRAS